MAFEKKITSEPVEKTFYMLGTNGVLKTSGTTIYFPFAEMQAGYSAQERARTSETEILDMKFENGLFTTIDPIQIEILENYHTGCTIQTP